MCKAMNRSLANVIFGGMGTSGPAKQGKVELCDVQTHQVSQAPCRLLILAPRMSGRLGYAGRAAGRPSPAILQTPARVTTHPHAQCHTEIDVNAASEALREADRVIIVPGYGMAVANAQHSVATLTTLLKDKGASVKYG